MADGITTIAALNWGTSTGGAAGSGEDTTTVGVDRQDQRTPPGLQYMWAAQFNNVKNLTMKMSQAFKGGTRIQLLPQSSNPFGGTESGCYIDTSGVFWSVYNGTRTKPASLTVYANTSLLTAGAAATAGTNGLAVSQSTNQLWITYDATNWSALS